MSAAAVIFAYGLLADASAAALRTAVDDGDRGAIARLAAPGVVPDTATFRLAVEAGGRAPPDRVRLRADGRRDGLRWFTITIDCSELDNLFAIVAGIDGRGRIVSLTASGITLL